MLNIPSWNILKCFFTYMERVKTLKKLIFLNLKRDKFLKKISVIVPNSQGTSLLQWNTSSVATTLPCICKISDPFPLQMGVRSYDHPIARCWPY